MARYDRREEVVDCDNSGAKLKGRSAIISPACYGGKAVNVVYVAYHEHPFSNAESDTFFLCEDCTKKLKADAEGHGYAVHVSSLKKAGTVDRASCMLRQAESEIDPDVEDIIKMID